MPICKLLENQWIFIFWWSNVPRTIKRLPKWCTTISRCQSQPCDVKPDITWLKSLECLYCSRWVHTQHAWELNENPRQKLGAVGTLVNECSLGEYSFIFTGIPHQLLQVASLLLSIRTTSSQPKAHVTLVTRSDQVASTIWRLVLYNNGRYIMVLDNTLKRMDKT